MGTGLCGGIMRRDYDSLSSACSALSPRRRSGRGWWAGQRGCGPAWRAAARTPRASPAQSAGSCSSGFIVNNRIFYLNYIKTCGAVALFPLQISASPGRPIFVFALEFYWWRVKNVVIKQIKPGELEEKSSAKRTRDRLPMRIQWA